MRWVVAVGLVGALSACAPAPTTVAEPAVSSSPSTTPAPAGEAPTRSRDLPAALDWSVAQLGGGQLEGGDLAGRDVVLWFWAPW